MLNFCLIFHLKYFKCIFIRDKHMTTTILYFLSLHNMVNFENVMKTEYNNRVSVSKEVKNNDGNHL